MAPIPPAPAAIIDLAQCNCKKGCSLVVQNCLDALIFVVKTNIMTVMMELVMFVMMRRIFDDLCLTLIHDLLFCIMI